MSFKNSLMIGGSDMWLYTFIPKLLNMTLTASIVIFCVLAARLLLKRAPKIFSYVLWVVVLFRLLCPVSITSNFSLLNNIDIPVSEKGSIDYIPSNIVHTENPSVQIPLPGISEAINAALSQGKEQLASDSLEAPILILALMWMAGIIGMVSYSIVSFIRLGQKLIGAVRLRGNIYLADYISSPFVLGIIRPKVYLPSTLAEKEQSYIIQHEQCHIRRCDHITKILAFIALCIHWFNPLVWVAFVLSSKDMEMSCDEATIKKMGTDIRADYSGSLLRLSSGKRIIAGSPLAFGEGDTRSRIKNIMNYKKPAFWVTVFAIIVILVLTIGLVSNPQNSNETTNFFSAFFANGYETSEVTDYEASAQEYKAHTSYQIFPDKIDSSMQSLNYFYQYKDFMFDPSIQRYFECSYDEENYKKEIKRLSQIQTEYEGERKMVRYDEKKFSYPAYITIDEYDHCYEFALLLGDNRIAYVFLQFINEENIGFDKEYLPLEYEQHKTENGYSIYLFEQTGGYSVGIY